MTRQRLYLFDTTLRCPFARSRAAREHKHSKDRHPAATGGGHHV